MADQPLGKKAPRILVAEDNATVQKIAVLLLEKLGFKVECVNNGQEAIDKLRGESFDLLLIDCQMPVLNGYQTTELIRSGRQGLGRVDLPIVAMTANESKSDQVKCLAVGMDDYISKPIELDALASILARWLPQYQRPQTSAKSSGMPSQGEALTHGQAELIDLQALKTLDALSARCKKNLVYELLSSFIQHYEERLEQMQGAFLSNNPEALEFAAHSLKSSASSLGLRTLAACCQKIESGAEVKDLTDCLEYFAELKAAYLHVRPTLLVETKKREHFLPTHG